VRLENTRLILHLTKPVSSRLPLKCDGTRPEIRFRLSAKRTGPFKSTGESVQSTTGSRGVRTSGSNAGYTKFRSSVKGTGYPLHSPVSPSLPLPSATVCHHVSTGLYTKSLVIHLSIRVPVQTPTHSPFNRCIPAGTTVNTVKLLSILMCQEPFATQR